MPRTAPLVGVCRDCGRDRPLKARGRCSGCDWWWRQHSGQYVPVRRRLGDRQWANEQRRAAWLAPAGDAPDWRTVEEIVGDDPALWAEVARVAAGWKRKREEQS